MGARNFMKNPRQFPQCTKQSSFIAATPGGGVPNNYLQELVEHMSHGRPRQQESLFASLR